jgi:tetratricopeptide (TPR) repeat protein
VTLPILVPAVLAALQATPTAEYLQAIERYRHGDRAVIRESWSEDRLRKEVAGIKRLVRAAEDCTECEARRRALEFPFEAAAMLLTARDIDERDSRLEEEVVASRPAPLLDLARQTIALIPDAERRQRFERPWFLAVSTHLYRRGQWPLAQEYMDLGLRLYPTAGELLLARGSIMETQSTAVEEVSLADVISRSGSRQIPDRRHLLARAESYYRRALAADPSLDEARTRLGRVLAQLGRREQAAAELEAVIAAAGVTNRTCYLAQLFLGALRESEGKLREAQAAYQAAINLEPKAQTGYLALSHARHGGGETAASLAPLRTAIGLAGSRQEWDPWWAYPWGQPYDLENLVEALHRAAQQ